MSQCPEPPANRASLGGRANFQAVKQFSRRGRGAASKVPTAWLVRLAARRLPRLPHAMDRSSSVPELLLQGASAESPRLLHPTGSCGARCPGRRLSSPLPGRGNGLGLRAVPPRGPPSRSCLAQEPSPPRRPYRSGHLCEVPVSPHLRREPRSRSSGNTLGCRDFPETKKRIHNPLLFLVPEGEMCAPGPHLGATESKWRRSRFGPK